MSSAYGDSPDLRARFLRTELSLFRSRFESDDLGERGDFVNHFDFGWEMVEDAEKEALYSQLRSCLPRGTKNDEAARETWFKVSVATTPTATVGVSRSPRS